MNTYEITYIITPKAADEERDRLNTELEQKISSLEGKIGRASAALRKQLMYPVKKEQAGFFRTIDITLASDKISEIHDWLKRNAQVMRFTILNTPPRKEITPDMVREMIAADKKGTGRRGVQKSDKKVTDEEVEKGIEEALTEEVK